MASKSALWCKGHIPYPVKLEDEIYSNSKDVIPIWGAFKENDCPSMIETRGRNKCFANKVRVNISTFSGLVSCVACNKIRWLFGSRKKVSKEHLEWFSRTHPMDYQYQCWETMFPDNDRERVVFSNEEWKDDCGLIEVRHQLCCSIPIEVQVSHVMIVIVVTNTNG